MHTHLMSHNHQHKPTKDTSPGAMRCSGIPSTSCKPSHISPYIPLTSPPGCTRQRQLGLSQQTSHDQTEPYISRMPRSLGTPSATISSSDSGTGPISPALRTAAPCTHGTYEDILESFKGPYYGWHWVYSSDTLGSGTSRGYQDGDLPVAGVKDLGGAGAGAGARN